MLSLTLGLLAGCSSDASGGDAAPTWVDEEVTFEADGYLFVNPCAAHVAAALRRALTD